MANHRYPHSATALHILLLCVALVAASCQAGAQEHVVRLRAGPVDVGAMSLSTWQQQDRQQQQQQPQQQQPHRSLLTQSAERHEHHVHAAWAHLAKHSTYLFTLAGAALEPSEQQRLLDGLHVHGGAVADVLPPNAWVVSAGHDAAEWLAEQPSTALAAFPATLKLAPEWGDALRALGRPDLACVLDDMVHSATMQDTVGASGAEPGDGDGDGDGDAATGAAVAGQQCPPGAAGSPGLPRLYDHTTTPRAGGRPQSPLSQEKAERVPGGAWLLIDVAFLELATRDLQRLHLERPAVANDPLQHAVNPHYELQRLAERQREQGQAAGAGGCSRGADGLLQGGACGRHYANGTLAPAVAAALDWAGPLQQVAQACGVDVVLEHGHLMVAACQEDLVGVLAWLAAQPSVRWLAPAMHAGLLNLRAGVITQRGELSVSDNPRSLALHRLWKAGIDGSGQVIGCGDSGVDLDSCYFNDPAVPLTSFTATQDSQAEEIYSSSSHRKLVMYYARGDNRDGNGHGTHVAGTLVGSYLGHDPATNPDDATGLAPGAKLAFVDLSSSAQNAILRPSNMIAGFYSYTFNAGARIHSDSWGSNVTSYDDLCRQVDSFSWDNPEFLAVFAAGNYGDQGGNNVMSTIKSPAVAKNSVAVGATWNMATLSTFGSSPSSLNMVITIPTPGGTVAGFTYTALLLLGSFGGDWSGLKGSSFPLAPAVPADACSSLDAGAVFGKVVVAVRGNCQYADKLRNAQAANAAALIITNNVNSGYLTLTSSSSEAFSTPVGSVPLGVGRYLWTAANASADGGGTVAFSDRPDTGATYDQLAGFSSYGPTSDGRIKPDLVAPGYLISAGTDGLYTGSATCGSQTATMQGTSMATPVTSASAALVRHYFSSGFYPTGAAVPDNAYSKPSGALVKAVLMAGAAPLLGNVMADTQMLMERPPSVRQGWGRVNLADSLPLADDGNTWRIQVVDGANITQGQTHQYCVQAAGGPLRIMLVWHDYPASVSASKALVNNLDLEVRAAGYGGLPMLGNGWADDTNNAESVTFDTVPEGNVAITVKGTSVPGPSSPQPYALVVLGEFSGVLQSPANPVGGSTSTSGNCVITRAVIDTAKSTPSLSNSSDLSLSFSTQAGTVAAGGFVCRLATAQGSFGASPLHNWTTCTSPRTYSGVNDGTFVFSVRSAQESVAVADNLTVTVDTTPPVTTLGTSLAGLGAGNNAASPLDTTAGNITFTFSAADATNVTFACRVQLADGRTSAYFRAAAPNSGLVLGQSRACTSPLALAGLSYGTWSLEVQATDAVGNKERTAPLRAWRVVYTAGTTYTRMASTPPALINNPSLAFTVHSFIGVSGAAPVSTPDSTTYQYRTWLTGNAPSTWRDATSASFSVDASSADGEWQIQARVAGGGTAVETFAVATVTVDTTPPDVRITSRPAAITSSATTTVRFATTPAGDAAAYFCRWLYNATAFAAASTAATGVNAFTTCNGTDASSAQAKVRTGYWVFQVKGRDQAGNEGAPVTAEFQVDTDAPTVSGLDSGIYTQNPAVNITYQAVDPSGGSGLANVTCVMKPLVRVTATSNRTLPTPGASFRAVTSEQQNPCPSPALYAVSEGSYMFSLTATDRAGLKKQVDVQVVLDLQAPRSTVVTRPTGDLPSQSTLVISATDYPVEGGDSGVNTTLCMFSRVAAVPPSSPASNATNVTTPATSGRRLLAGSPQLSGGAAIVWGTWQTCTCCSVTYQNFVSGNYSLKVKAVDRAGNEGAASGAQAFSVDDTLPIDPNSPQPIVVSTQGAKWRFNRTAIIVIVALGVALAIAFAIMVVVARRRKAAAQAAAVAAAQLQQHHPFPLVASPAPPSRHIWLGSPQTSRPTRAVGGPQPSGASTDFSMSLAPPVDLAALVSADDARVRRAMRESKDDENMRKAIAESKQTRGKPSSRARNGMTEEERVEAALKASREEYERRYGRPPQQE